MYDRAMLLIDESLDDDGTPRRTYLDHGPSGGEPLVLVIAEPGTRGLVPVRAVEVVLRRYGRPLDDEVFVDGPALDLGQGRELRAFRFRARVDAAARDYLCWRVPGREPVAALSRDVAVALRYLATRMPAA